MPHARAQIVAAATERLKTLTTVAANHVQAGRKTPLPVAKTPFLMVFGRTEDSGPATLGGPRRKLQRQLTLRVEAVTPSPDDDSMVDAIAAEVEVALMADPTLGGVAKDLWLARTNMDARAEGETQLGRATFDFTVTYFTVASAPDQAA